MLPISVRSMSSVCLVLVPELYLIVSSCRDFSEVGPATHARKCNMIRAEKQESRTRSSLDKE